MYSESQLNETVGLFGLSMMTCDEMSGGSKWMGRRYATETDEGKFFLKVRSDWWPTSQAKYVCGLLQDLNAQGFPVPSLRQAAAGELFALWQGHVCECHAFVDGQGHTLGKLGQVAAVGRELSRFHSLTATWDLPGDFLPDSCGYPREQRVHFFADRVRDFFAEDASGLEALDQLLDHLRAVPVSQDRALVHGDYHSANMIFREDQILVSADREHRFGELLWPQVLGWSGIKFSGFSEQTQLFSYDLLRKCRKRVEFPLQFLVVPHAGSRL